MAIAAILGLAALLTLTALEDSIVYFYGPSELAEKSYRDGPHSNQRIRVGGLVVDGSVHIAEESASFRITDGTAEVSVSYDGILPDLFRVGQGIIAEGVYDGTLFTADIILAKHDETYMPAEVVDILKDKGVWQQQ
jgi:cytochrome c-type biogenesis protein CcmE